MKNLITYSGITTKVRAMEGRFFKESEYTEMAQLDHVSDAVDFLKKNPSYSDLFLDKDNYDLHRGTIEELLTLSLYRDFTKLYRFSNPKQRRFLDLYFTHYEIVILKKCLRNALSHQSVHLDLAIFQEFFEYHSSLDINQISSSLSIEEFTANLEGSKYYELISHLTDKGNRNLFDYELQFDLYFFRSLWKDKKIDLTKQERGTLRKCFGSNLDLLNLQWIYRSKKYYQLNNTDIYSLLIPVLYRLNKDQLAKLVESSSLDDFFNLLKNTYYGSMITIDLSEPPDLEKLSEQVLNHVYRQTSRKAPYSIAILNSYLYFKEIEIKKIVTIIEGIRYGLTADAINSYVVKI